MVGKITDPLRKKEVAATPEEEVRQWFIGVMRDRMGVPLYKMMSEVEMKVGEARKSFRADIVVYDRQSEPLMVVECKRPSVEMTREVVSQVLTYNAQLDAPWVAVTNGKFTAVFHRTSEGWKQADTLPKYEEMI